MIHHRSYILLPGHEPDSLSRADKSGADLVVFDFEDMVPDGEKPKARLRVRTWLETEDLGDTEIAVRINAFGSGPDRIDRTSLAGLDLVHIVIPKVSSAAEVERVAEALSEAGVGAPQIHVIIETPKAVAEINEIAAAQPASLFVGAFDLAAVLTVDPSPNTPEILSARQKIASVAKDAGVAAFDMPFIDLTDVSGFEDHIAQTKGLGFTGCCAMNADQAAKIRQAFTTS